jgi:hypothetical protein
MVYENNLASGGEQGKFIVQNALHWKILHYSVFKLLPQLGDLLNGFASWLDSPKGINPLLSSIFSRDLAELFFKHISHHYKDEHLDWFLVYEHCDNFLEICEQDQFLLVQKIADEAEKSYDQEGYFFSILEDCLRSLSHQLGFAEWDFDRIANPFIDNGSNGFVSICKAMFPLLIGNLTNHYRALLRRNLDDSIPQLEEHIKTCCDTNSHVRTSKSLIKSTMYTIVVLHLWDDREFARSSLSSFCTQLLAPKVADPQHLLMMTDFVGKLTPILNQTLGEYGVSPNPYLLRQMHSTMLNNKGVRLGSTLKQAELNQVLFDLSVPRLKTQLKGKKPLSDEIEIQWVRNSLQCDTREFLDDPSQEQIFRQFLKANIVKEIFPNKMMVFDPDHPKRVTEGTRFVMPIQVDANRSVHLKAYPELPSVHIAIDNLFRRISGNSASATLTRFYRGKNASSHPVLISKTIPGRTLFAWMQTRETILELEQSLCPIAFSFKVLETLLVNPEDDKPDNFIVEPFIGATGKTLHRIISVDTDHAFGVPILRDSAGKEIVNVKTAVFCLSKMSELLNEEAVLTFLQLDPFETLLDWLKSLSEYQAYITGSKYTVPLFSKEEQINCLKYQGFSIRGLLGGKKKDHASVLPLDFHPKLIGALYRRFVNLQEVLRKDIQQPTPQLTHIKLVSLIEPRLAAFYENLLNTYDNAAHRWENLPTNYIKLPMPSSNISMGRRESMPSPSRSEENFNSLSKTITIGYGNYKKDHLDAIKKSQVLGPFELQTHLVLVHHKYQELKKRSDQIANGDVYSALNGIELTVGEKAKATQKEMQSLTDLSSFLVENIFEKIDWSQLCDILDASKIQYVLDKLNNVIGVQRLQFRNCYAITQPMITRYLKNNFDSLRVLDLSGDRQFSSKILRVIAKNTGILDELHISRMDWICVDFTGVKFPYLRKLYMSDCKALTRVKLGNLPYLERMYVEYCDKLKDVSFDFEKSEWVLRYISFSGATVLSYDSFVALYRGLKSKSIQLCSSWTDGTDYQVSVCEINLHGCISMLSRALSTGIDLEEASLLHKLCENYFTGVKAPVV